MPGVCCFALYDEKAVPLSKAASFALCEDEAVPLSRCVLHLMLQVASHLRVVTLLVPAECGERRAPMS